MMNTSKLTMHYQRIYVDLLADSTKTVASEELVKSIAVIRESIEAAEELKKVLEVELASRTEPVEPEPVPVPEPTPEEPTPA